MKGFILASLLVVTVSATLLEEDGAHFQSFKLNHGKIYKNQAEETKRFAIFRENLRKIEAHNAEYEQGLHTYTQGVNKFTDLTSAEFKSLLTLQTKTKPTYNITKTFELAAGVSVPEAVDWRSQNAVTAIKDQLDCGASWAFSVVGSTESAYALSTGNLLSFSEQQLIDCTNRINFGCDLGYLDETYPYIQSNGLELETDYPYIASEDYCNYESSKVVTRISSYISIPRNEKQLRQAVGTVGPVAVSINADYIQSYSSGIFDNADCQPYPSNQGVLIVGYGSENGQDYWIIKNSWGATWGESGYFRLLRGQDICGVKEDAVYPII